MAHSMPMARQCKTLIAAGHSTGPHRNTCFTPPLLYRKRYTHLTLLFVAPPVKFSTQKFTQKKKKPLLYDPATTPSPCVVFRGPTRAPFLLMFTTQPGCGVRHQALMGRKANTYYI